MARHSRDQPNLCYMSSFPGTAFGSDGETARGPLCVIIGSGSKVKVTHCPKVTCGLIWVFSDGNSEYEMVSAMQWWLRVRKWQAIVRHARSPLITARRQLRTHTRLEVPGPSKGTPSAQCSNNDPVNVYVFISQQGVGSQYRHTGL